MTSKKKPPFRKCVGCQEMKDKKTMIRIVRTDDGRFSIDAGGRQNGRGAYICPDEQCLQKAVRSKGLERSFRQQMPEDLYDTLREELMRIGK